MGLGLDQGGVFIGLGSNLGNRADTLRAALRDLGAVPGIEIRCVSTFHETEPVGGPRGQPNFLNAVAELITSQPPGEILRVLQEIEKRHGRERGALNGPRTLDLDLLVFRDQVIDTPDLRVPHPRMWQRDFVLAPLAELCDVPRLRQRFNANSR